MKKILLIFIMLSFISVLANDEAMNISSKNKKQNKSDTIKTQIDWGPYMYDLEQRIKRNWDPAKKDVSKKVTVNMKIAKDGKLRDVQITHSSEDEEIDKSAIEAIEKTEPFRPLPEDFKGETATIEFTFGFNTANKNVNQTPNLTKEDSINSP